MTEEDRAMIEAGGSTIEADKAMIEAEKGARNWAVLGHLSALLFLFGIPFGNILGPLVVWLVKRNDHPFIDEQCKEALNFQITMTLYIIAASILLFILGMSLIPIFWPFNHHNYWDAWSPLTMPFAFLSGILLMIVIVLLDIALLLIAALKASNGEHYRYPLTLRLIK